MKNLVCNAGSSSLKFSVVELECGSFVAAGGERVCENLNCPGLELDGTANEACWANMVITNMVINSRRNEIGK